jgi:hypothetical protein
LKWYNFRLAGLFTSKNNKRELYINKMSVHLEKLQSMYFDIVKGKSEKHAAWLTLV